jgi:anti-sigma factor (TIGR02949 family)
MSETRNISCEDALRLVHEFLDGELDDVSPEEVRGHFDICQRCYPHLRFEEAFRKAVRRAAGRETAPTELRERLLRMIAEPSAER